MTQVNVAEAKARLSELIDRALSGEEVIISRRDVPVIRLVPELDATRRNLLGLVTGGIAMEDDFDAPIPGFEDLGG